MQKKQLYPLLMRRRQAYETSHRRTAEIDILIIQKFHAGKSAVRISMEVPCSEATVYRALNRVTHFLSEEYQPCQTAGLPSDAKKKKS